MSSVVADVFVRKTETVTRIKHRHTMLPSNRILMFTSESLSIERVGWRKIDAPGHVEDAGNLYGYGKWRQERFYGSDLV